MMAGELGVCRTLRGRPAEQEPMSHVRCRRSYRSIIPRGLMLAGSLAAASLATAAAGEAEPGKITTEHCVKLAETKIIGPICKVFIRNDCTHPVDLTIRYTLVLRRLVILPIIAEGNSTEYQAAGTAEAEQARPLEAGEAGWFINKSEGKGIEVAKCNVGFSYTYIKTKDRGD